MKDYQTKDHSTIIFLVKRRDVWVVVPVVWLFFFLALDSVVEDSPTMDEQNHIARGLAFLRTGDARLSLEHPPLVNGLSGLPLLLLPEVRLPTDHPSWEAEQGWYEFADLLLWKYNADVTRMVFLARLPVIFLTVGLALAGYHLARVVWGRPSSLPAFLLLLFDPNVLAHGRYATTDVGGTAFVLLATLLLWRMWQVEGWHWQRWVWAGVGVGLAVGSKLSVLVFGPVWLGMAIWMGEGNGRKRRVWQLLSCGVVALPVLWLIFGLEWGHFRFRGGLVGWFE